MIDYDFYYDNEFRIPRFIVKNTDKLRFLNDLNGCTFEYLSSSMNKFQDVLQGNEDEFVFGYEVALIRFKKDTSFLEVYSFDDFEIQTNEFYKFMREWYQFMKTYYEYFYSPKC